MKTKTVASSCIIPTHSAYSTATAASTTAAPAIATAAHAHPSSSTSSSSTTNTTTAAKTKEEEEEKRKKTEEEAEKAKRAAQEEQKEAYRVVDLPGLPSDVEFADQYAGYIPVESPAVNGTSSLPPSFLLFPNTILSNDILISTPLSLPPGTSKGGRLFFWLHESQTSPEDPLVIWLNGGEEGREGGRAGGWEGGRAQAKEVVSSSGCTSLRPHPKIRWSSG